MKYSRFILSFLVVLLFIGCKKKEAQRPNSDSDSGAPITKTYKVTSEGATIEDVATGVVIEVPKGATTKNCNISVIESDLPNKNLNFIGGKNFPSLGRQFEINKNSESLFRNPVTVSLPYNPENVTGNEALSVAYYSKVLEKWIPIDIDRIDTVHHKVVFLTIHFTSFAIVNMVSVQFMNKDPNSFTSFNTGYLPNVDGFGLINYYFPDGYVSNWNGEDHSGHCWGFAALSLRYYDIHKDLPPFQHLFAMTFKGSADPKKPVNLPIVEAIDKAQQKLSGKSIHLWDQVYSGYGHFTDKHRICYKDAAFMVYSRLKTLGLPICVALFNKDAAHGHEIVVYKYEKGKNGTGRFYYYNPNVNVLNLVVGDSLYFTHNADGTINTFKYLKYLEDSISVEYIFPSFAKGGGLTMKFAKDLFQQYFTGPTSTTTIIRTNSIIPNSASAVGGGVVLYNGGSAVIARGVCWSTSKDPTINDHKTIDGSGDGSFTSKLTDLEPNTTYYVRAYAINDQGTGYGNEVSFKTARDHENDENGYASLIIGSWANVEAYNVSFDGDTTNHDYFYSSPMKSSYDEGGIVTTPAYENTQYYKQYYKTVGKILFRSLDPLPASPTIASLEGGNIWAFSINKLDSETLILCQIGSSGNLTDQYYVFKRVN